MSDPLPVSRETHTALGVLLSELARWQRRINLVAPSTLADAATRHVADSLQLMDVVPPGPLTWIDLGSGGGFPGLVAAIALRERPGSHVHLVEATAKKCAFLRHMIALTGAPATVHDMRIARFFETPRPADIVSARALAPLTDLVAMSAATLMGGALGVFPKGAGAAEELAAARRAYDIDAQLVPSRTAPEARIVLIDRVRPLAPADAPARHDAAPPAC